MIPQAGKLSFLCASFILLSFSPQLALGSSMNQTFQDQANSTSLEHPANPDNLKSFEKLFESATQGDIEALDRCNQIYKKLKLFKKMFENAAQGDIEAQYELGLWYEKNKDDSTAFEWFYKAADKGNTEAQYKLGTLFYEGRGVEKNEQQALRWYTEAANKGHTEALDMYDRLYKIDTLFESAMQGDVEAQYELGLWYEKNKDDSTAFDCFYEAAEKGHTEAQYKLGTLFNKGRGVEKNEQQALRWYIEAAVNEHSEALYKLGKIYEEYKNNLIIGKKLYNSISEAFEELSKDAAQGDVETQYELGLWYEKNKDDSTAFDCFYEAAEKGHTEAQYKLGTLFNKGRGIEGNEFQAVGWYIAAAVNEHSEALYKLGKIYEENKNDLVIGKKLYSIGRIHEIKKNKLKALEYFSQAIKHGNEQAWYKLGLEYAEGRWIKKNRKEAFEWYFKAVKKGHVKAQQKLLKMLEEGLWIKKNTSHWYCKMRNQEYIETRSKRGLKYAEEKDLIIGFLFYVTEGKQGNVEAQYQTGLIYEKEEFIFTKGLIWYFAAANEGHVEAQYKLGRLYERRGKKENAFEWYLRAAQKGHLSAQGKLYLHYEYEQDEWKENKPKYFQFLFEAAEEGDADALYDLAIGFYHGRQLEQNKCRALKLLRKATIQNHVRAQSSLGNILYYGQIIEKDPKTAALLYYMAARQEDREAQFNLAITYEYGHGKSKDEEEAKKWYTKAANHGLGDAYAQLGLIEFLRKNKAQAITLLQKAASNNNYNLSKYLLGLFYSFDQDQPTFQYFNSYYETSN